MSRHPDSGAIQSGARQQQACQVLGLTSRTYQRWSKAGIVSDGRITTARPAPANKLSDDEREQILTVCNTPVYAHLPPYQIVPRLADQGIYLASESSFYRILKAANQPYELIWTEGQHIDTDRAEVVQGLVNLVMYRVQTTR